MNCQATKVETALAEDPYFGLCLSCAAGGDMRDDRPAGDLTPPAGWIGHSQDRKGIHPQTHLTKFERVLQADAYAGSTPCTKSAGSTKRHVGRTRVASSTTCTWCDRRRSRQRCCAASPNCT
jgi:hypothetical protein